LRNVALIAHGNAGKTSLADAILHVSKSVNRLGKVDEGNSVFDFSDDEIRRKLTISTSIGFCEWDGKKINIIDTPGYLDFIGEVISALRVADGAVVVVDALSGVEVGTEIVGRIAEQHHLPKIIYLSKIEKENATFAHNLHVLRDVMKKNIIPLTVPVGEGLTFEGFIDPVMGKAVLKEGGKMVEGDIPENHTGLFEEYREQLIEAVAESDDSLLEKYLEAGTLTGEEVSTGLRAGVKSGEIIPLIVGATLEEVGVKELLNAIARYFPSPEERGSVNALKGKEEIDVHPSSNSPFSALVFKTFSEPHIGELYYFKVMSGSATSGMDVYNNSTSKSERLGQLLAVKGKERIETDELTSGDIGAVTKLKDTHTGNTLSVKGYDITFPEIDFPHPVIAEGIRPKSKGDEEKISNGIQKLREEDPTILFEVDKETRQSILSGMGELHLEIVTERLKHKFNVEVELTKPRIPYRETIVGTAAVQGKYKKQSGGRGQYGDVWIRFEPRSRGEGFLFQDEIVGGVVPNKYIPAVEKGLLEAQNEGVVAGYPMVDFSAALYDGSYHSVDSSDMAFKIAASMAFKKGVAEASPILLEPIYEVEVIVPEEYMGDVIGDLNSRRGRIQGVDPEGHLQKIRATVPQAEMYKYSTHLRSMTQGRGVYSMRFQGYEQVPRELVDRVVAEYKDQEESE
jgi:elongation factor G